MTPFVFAVDLLATYRITRLVTADVITEPIRRSIVDHTVDGEVVADLVEQEGEDQALTALDVVEALDEPPKLARLITCRWCAGVWIAGGVVAARRLTPTLWDPLATAMALSAGAVLLARAESD